MTDRTTELLRKLLDERGVEYEAYRDIKNRCITKWRTYHGAFVFFAVEEEGKLFVETASDTEHSAICTPEQAIAATLGDEWDGKPFVEYAEHVAMELRNEAWALLEGCDEPDFSAIEAIYAACDDIVTVAGRWKRGESQDEAATLGSGNADTDDALALLDEIREAGRITYDDYSQLHDAISMTGSGTCEQVLTDCDDGMMPPFTANCSACGAEWGFTPRYCHNCGAEVTGTRDERKAVSE